MRYRIYAIIHLIILAFYLGRPLIPYIQYAIFKDYIAKNLCINRDKPRSCCQGKCYLEKQVKKTNETHDTDTRNNTRKIQTREINEFLGWDLSIPKVFEINIPFAFCSETYHTVSAIASIFVPPENTSII